MKNALVLSIAHPIALPTRNQHKQSQQLQRKLSAVRLVKALVDV
jgi:hypothetical protein